MDDSDLEYFSSSDEDDYVMSHQEKKELKVLCVHKYELNPPGFFHVEIVNHQDQACPSKKDDILFIVTDHVRCKSFVLHEGRRGGLGLSSFSDTIRPFVKVLPHYHHHICDSADIVLVDSRRISGRQGPRWHLQLNLKDNGNRLNLHPLP